MARIDRNQLKKLILKEFKMMGMMPMDGGMIGHSPHASMEYDHPGDGHEVMHDIEISMPASGGMMSKGTVSKEDCCRAVLCLVECCDCPDTKEMLRQCCEDILSSC